MKKKSSQTDQNVPEFTGVGFFTRPKNMAAFGLYVKYFWGAFFLYAIPLLFLYKLVHEAPVIPELVAGLGLLIGSAHLIWLFNRISQLTTHT